MAARAQEISKGSLRSDYKDQLKVRLKDSSVKTSWDQQICLKLAEALRSFGSRVGLFRSIQGEPDLFSLTQMLDKDFYFPRVEGPDLHFLKFTSESKWQMGSWGISELDPETSPKVSISELDVMVIPGLAFDLEGHRLGRGKGFYDRALAGYSGVKLGVGYSFQVNPSPLPHEPHDVVMNQLITEEKMIVVKG